jgi:hypothetical protein
VAIDITGLIDSQEKNKELSQQAETDRQCEEITKRELTEFSDNKYIKWPDPIRKR